MTAQQSSATPSGSELHELVRETFGDGRWFETPNAHLRGRTPRESVEAGDADQVRAIIDAVIYVGVS